MVDVILTTSESLLRWWNIKEAKTIPGTRTVGSAAMLFVFCSPEERYYSATYSQPQRRMVEFRRLRFSSAVTWVFYAARRVCFSGLNHLLLEGFLCRRRIKHCREYFTTVQVFISLCRFAFPPYSCSFFNLSLFRKTCNGTATIFFPVSRWNVPEFISSYCLGFNSKLACSFFP